MSKVADPLRSFVAGSFVYDLKAGGHFDEKSLWEIVDGLEKVADEIDREHERRMDQAREDSRKATCNYMSRIIADYKRGKKWKRKEYSNEQKH